MQGNHEVKIGVLFRWLYSACEYCYESTLILPDCFFSWDLTFAVGIWTQTLGQMPILKVNTKSIMVIELKKTK